VLVSSFFSTRSTAQDWRLIITDDGSTDGTLTYLDDLKEKDRSIEIILNNRKGVHHQFNSIIKKLEQLDFDLCLKCDDDIEFIKSGWENLYIKAIKETGFDHLCFFDTKWRPEKNLRPPVEQGPLISHCHGMDVQGAFFTITPEMIKKVGYMDTKNFGFRGVGHIDYTMRACRLGFNDINHPFDAKGSHAYIRSQTENYTTALPEELLEGLEDEMETQRKYALVKENRTYIPFNEWNESLDINTERGYLMRAVQSLRKQKQWYEEEIGRLKQWEKEQYGYLPGWYLKVGKLFKLFRK
jgi:glycosyltransferase involved in cell wall biosynthesis